MSDSRDNIVYFPIEKTRERLLNPSAIKTARLSDTPLEVGDISPKARLTKKLFSAIVLTNSDELDELISSYNVTIISMVIHSEDFRNLIRPFIELKDFEFNKGIKEFYDNFLKEYQIEP